MTTLLPDGHMFERNRLTVHEYLQTLVNTSDEITPNERMLINRAVDFSIGALGGQDRDEGGSQLTHSMRVAIYYLHRWPTEDPGMGVILSLLHDVLEYGADRKVLKARFSRRTLRHVSVLTKDKLLPEKQWKEEYRQRIRNGTIEMVRQVAFAEIVDNLRSCFLLLDHYEDKVKNYTEEIDNHYLEMAKRERVHRHIKSLLDDLRGG